MCIRDSVKTASEFLESQYGYYNAIYAYEDLEIHKGTAEEINHYIAVSYTHLDVYKRQIQIHFFNMGNNTFQNGSFLD